jgi:hypothetical protein
MEQHHRPVPVLPTLLRRPRWSFVLHKTTHPWRSWCMSLSLKICDPLQGIDGGEAPPKGASESIRLTCKQLVASPQPSRVWNTDTTRRSFEIRDHDPFATRAIAMQSAPATQISILQWASMLWRTSCYSTADGDFSRLASRIRRTGKHLRQENEFRQTNDLSHSLSPRTLDTPTPRDLDAAPSSVSTSSTRHQVSLPCYFQ